jgi:2-oxoglutarate ferredoxin oxidoreductase subunit delta
MTTDKPERKKRCYQVHVDSELCDGCGVCIFFCKPAVFRLSPELGRRGVFPALPEAPGVCTGCTLCELGCPQLAIAVFDDEPNGGVA